MKKIPSLQNNSKTENHGNRGNIYALKKDIAFIM
jgi:hypothetical protein